MNRSCLVSTHTIVMMLEIVTTEFHLVCTILVSAQGGNFQQIVLDTMKIQLVS
jgi:hypothetical protein